MINAFILSFTIIMISYYNFTYTNIDYINQMWIVCNITLYVIGIKCGLIWQYIEERKKHNIEQQAAFWKIKTICKVIFNNAKHVHAIWIWMWIVCIIELNPIGIKYDLVYTYIVT